METAKYILDFFFGPGAGWHFLGLCVLFLCIRPHIEHKVYVNNEKKDKDEED